MSKRVLTIIVAAGLALLLGVILIIVSTTPENSESGNNSSLSSGITSSEEETDVNGYLAVYSFDDDQIRRAEVKNQHGEYTVTYVKEDTFSVSGIEEFNLNADTISDLVTASMQIYATKTIAEDPEDMATYGLDKPVAEIKFSYDTGESVEIKIGADCPSGGAYAYVKNSN